MEQVGARNLAEVEGMDWERELERVEEPVSVEEKGWAAPIERFLRRSGVPGEGVEVKREV